MKLKCHIYVGYPILPSPLDEWKEIPLPTEPFSSIDNCWHWLRHLFPNAQIRMEWTYGE
jgi:hypothetical protein